ncbi:unnamed protein product [Brachionus calyciflorus]|uniref:SEA domain-containing protein n=1 Tax=Brachionus calyciflorus TaxID=104777 RepID=A0A814CBS5_9BILA|nr:unnamed protein product [Brachionus calyciflorus]
MMRKKFILLVVIFLYNIRAGGTCSLDTDCKDSTKPLCDTASGACIAKCTLDTDCKDSTKPLCDTASGACIAKCTLDTDCKDSTKPLCDTASGFCYHTIKTDFFSKYTTTIFTKLSSSTYFFVSNLSLSSKTTFHTYEQKRTPPLEQIVKIRFEFLFQLASPAIKKRNSETLASFVKNIVRDSFVKQFGLDIIVTTEILKSETLSLNVGIEKTVKGSDTNEINSFSSESALEIMSSNNTFGQINEATENSGFVMKTSPSELQVKSITETLNPDGTIIKKNCETPDNCTETLENIFQETLNDSTIVLSSLQKTESSSSNFKTYESSTSYDTTDLKTTNLNSQTTSKNETNAILATSPSFETLVVETNIQMSGGLVLSGLVSVISRNIEEQGQGNSLQKLNDSINEIIKSTFPSGAIISTKNIGNESVLVIDIISRTSAYTNLNLGTKIKNILEALDRNKTVLNATVPKGVTLYMDITKFSITANETYYVDGVKTKRSSCNQNQESIICTTQTYDNNGLSNFTSNSIETITLKNFSVKIVSFPIYNFLIIIFSALKFNLY